ncbi:HD domain-containing phosphohydrolase [Desulfosporosinus sp. BICA1-9]|uniref:HD domain-containing phosphohydrolase n=1 Tax=Desulfosporosinus sp. BICA1-9 TaxID=1531958 RepID=UPI00054B5EFF|nr:HD domain-containing phosphohydrolase [Desulfosporosinus sp. BICA1-9]KJS46860.1 MAG: histidine kinase [Peptococcaceae bacterium BRH_c23]KJS81861.1 MAG: histidine kinase [Desulfosporosinus sp. BICA1-9]HBW35706.1 HD domain-containing protein [Desulfosporosinus sp.]
MHELQDLEVKLKKDLAPEQMLRIIFHYISLIAPEKDLDRILLYMADMGRELILADRCTLWLHDKETHQLWTKVAHGVKALTMPEEAGFAGYALKNNKSILIEDAYQDARFNPEVDLQTGYHTKSVLVIPIQNQHGENMGIFQAINKLTTEGVFNYQDMHLLTLAASYSGKALESAMLNQEIEQTQKEIIYLMGEIGESRSKETGNHVKRVAEYSKILALRLGMSPAEAELIKISSPMHDIGKVAIPDAILKKPGKLTDQEFTEMQAHTIIGNQLLKKSNRQILQSAAIIAHQHHEKWNGTGYPQGLKGEEIHIYGRITALADVFDALASDRCYKQAWEIDRVINLFKEERGVQFDPHLVDAFLNCLEEILALKEQYAD